MSINPELGARLTFVLAITNVIGLALVFFSCRCLIGNRVTASFSSKRWFRRFYGVHCYFWWFLFSSVLAHAVLALLTYGIPF